MSENSLKEQLEAILKDAYPGEMKLFDEHVMQNPVLDTEQKFTIIFQLIMDKLESFKYKEELLEHYKFAALKCHGRAMASPLVIAELVLLGWRNAEDERQPKNSEELI